MNMDVKEFCMAWLKYSEVKFLLRGGEVTGEDVFSSRGLMPALAKRADKIHSLIYGVGIGASYKKYEASMLGEEVEFDDSVSKSILLHIFLYVIDQLVITSSDDKGRVVVDELLYE